MKFPSKRRLRLRPSLTYCRTTQCSLKETAHIYWELHFVNVWLYWIDFAGFWGVFVVQHWGMWGCLAPHPLFPTPTNMLRIKRSLKVSLCVWRTKRQRQHTAPWIFTKIKTSCCEFCTCPLVMEKKNQKKKQTVVIILGTHIQFL